MKHFHITMVPVRMPYAVVVSLSNILTIAQLFSVTALNVTSQSTFLYQYQFLLAQTRFEQIHLTGKLQTHNFK